MNIKNLSQLKKHAKDFSFTMINHNWFPNNFKLKDLERKVAKVQSKNMQFEGGSWLDFQKADDFSFVGDKMFVKLDDLGNKMTYKLKYLLK